MGGCILDELKANSAYFSAVECHIADIILRDPDRFTKYSLAELAQDAGVSQGSIVNFSHKFADGGFPTLKLRVAACLSDYCRSEPTVVGKDDDVFTILKKNNQNILSALQNTESSNSEETLKKAAEMILAAKKVEIYGVFRSALVATDFCYQLLQLGISASFVSDVLTCAVSACVLPKDSLVIAVSYTGQTKDILDAVKLAKGNGVPILALTGNRNSPLAKLSDLVLVAGCSGNSLLGLQSEMRISQLALADAVCTYLQNKMYENGKERLFKMETILDSHSVNE